MKDIINQYKAFKEDHNEDYVRDEIFEFVGGLGRVDLHEVFEYLEQLHNQIEEIEQLRLKNKG